MKKNIFDLTIITLIAIFLYWCVTTSPFYKEAKARQKAKIEWREIDKNIDFGPTRKYSNNE